MKWIKCEDGTLLNVDKVEYFYFGEKKVRYGQIPVPILGASIGPEDYVAIISGDKELCQTVLKEIENAITNFSHPILNVMELPAVKSNQFYERLREEKKMAKEFDPEKVKMT